MRDELEVEHGGECDEDDEYRDQQTRRDPGRLVGDGVELHPTQNRDFDEEQQNSW